MSAAPLLHTACRLQVDAATRAGMEKRVGVLKKELNVLKDVLERNDIAKVLHGLSQVMLRIESPPLAVPSW